MQGVPHSLTQSESCIGDGFLDPSVIAEVPEWRKRSDAKRHLTGLGWTKESVTHYRSPDGDSDAGVVLEVNNNEVVAVTVRFRDADS